MAGNHFETWQILYFIEGIPYFGGHKGSNDFLSNMKYSIISLVFFAVIGCSSIQTSYEYDKQADFGKYKTYNYTSEALALREQPQVVRDGIIQAIDRQMTSLGFTKSDNADILIDLLLKTQEKQDGAAAYTKSYYGITPGLATATIDTNEHVVGTLFIILVDKQKNKMIWQSRGTKVLDEKASDKKRENNINKAVKTMFKNYPAKGK
jgi:hypothetical protein